MIVLSEYSLFCFQKIKKFPNNMGHEKFFKNLLKKITTFLRKFYENVIKIFEGFQGGFKLFSFEMANMF
jgi:hypothetical protein